MSDLMSETSPSRGNNNDTSDTLSQRICPVSRYDCRDGQVISENTSITLYCPNLFLVRRKFITRTLPFRKTSKNFSQMYSTTNRKQRWRFFRSRYRYRRGINFITRESLQ